MISPPKSPDPATSRPTPEHFLPKHRPPTHRSTANAPFPPATPFSPPSGPAQRPPQGPPSKSKFLAAKDSWGTWDTEAREEIFQLIDEKKESLVLLLSGDRHGARAFAIPRPGGGRIYELEAGTLGGVPGPGALGVRREDQLIGYPGRTWAYGELALSLVDGRPHSDFRLIGVDGNEMEKLSLQC